MPDNEVDPLTKGPVGDAVEVTTSQELRKLLHELASALDPFPKFMDLTYIEAVEVEPPGPPDPERGCIVVCSDGEIREFVLRMIPGPFDTGGVEQTEELNDVDMSPGEYATYARAAVHELETIIEARRQSDG